MLHFVVPMRNELCQEWGKKESWRKKFNPCPLSDLHTAGQSPREVGMNVGSSVSESYRNLTREREFLKLFNRPTSTSDGVYWPLQYHHYLHSDHNRVRHQDNSC